MAAISNSSSYVKLSSFVVVAVVALVLMVAPEATASVSCDSVTSRLTPCMNYVTGGGLVPPSSTCCSGIKGLKSGLKLQADRQAACQCLKDLGSRYAGLVNLDLISSLPSKCGGVPPLPHFSLHQLQEGAVN